MLGTSRRTRHPCAAPQSTTPCVNAEVNRGADQSVKARGVSHLVKDLAAREEPDP